MVGRLGGFHFNDSKYGDDDLTVGSVHPYQLFLVMLELLEHDNHVRQLLGDEAEGTSVRLGAETDLPDADFAVVSTAFDAGRRGLGRVGVLGPMRMDYRRTIRIVEEVGDGLEDSLGI